jgi:hypothetical protein
MGAQAELKQVNWLILIVLLDIHHNTVVDFNQLLNIGHLDGLEQWIETPETL